jgi:hypothetical protein
MIASPQAHRALSLVEAFRIPILQYWTSRNQKN